MAVGSHNKIHGQAAALEPGVTYTPKYHAPQSMNIFTSVVLLVDIWIAEQQRNTLHKQLGI